MASQTTETPSLVVDAARLQANIDRVAAWGRNRGLQIRPHVKTHKMPQVARLQLAAGAVGITVATVGEGEVFADSGCTDLFIAYPVWLDQGRAERLRRLTGRARVRVGCDSLTGLRALAGLDVEVMLELDSGQHRSGVGVDQVHALTGAAVEMGVNLVGVFTFPGHSYGPGARMPAAQQESATLAAGGAAMREAGMVPRVISGGSTPSLEFTGEGLTEVRPGVYAFGDAQQWELGACQPEQIALTCHARVVSRAGGRTVLDSGSKVLGADRAAYATGFGRLLDHPDARVVLLSEHHAVVATDADLPLGTVVRVVPNHVCNAVNLVDAVTVCDADGTFVDRWGIAARGRNF